jgi:nicotinate-nucleotide adenylyltransferase
MRVGLFFGSFNPIHLGHLIIGNYMVHHAGLDEVWYVVSPHNPFKEKAGLLDENLRLEMVRLAVEDNPVLKASNIEFSMPRPSYTIDTLHRLEKEYPSTEWILLMGADTAMTLPGWKSFEELVKGYDIYVYPRPGEAFVKPDWGWRLTVFNDAPVMEISATFIRKAIGEGRSVRYLVPREVERYIEEKRLFSPRGTPAGR